jgi:hypothetical protein
LQVEKDRRPKENLQDKKWNMAVDEEYMNELLKYDFTSTKKGRGFSSLLVQRKKNQQYPDAQRVDQEPLDELIPNNQLGVLHVPSGVMDVKLWHDKLTP